MPEYNNPHGSNSADYGHPKPSYPAFPTSLAKVGFGKAIAIGIGIGAAGGLAMLCTQKLEQLLTNRPNSYVPARTISTHLGLSSDVYRRNTEILNHAHHFAMAMLAGPIRALMAYYGVVGPFASFVFTGVRIAMDQGFEIGAGVSDWPWKWTVGDQVVDVLQKGVYAFVVGWACDYYVRGFDWFG